ncbi:hypothetical protein FACS1894190_08760 [Spirochaetia bacterium]|nr:hypothetical protein FACS1894190_08760 [Spirochaetia bacterium]
METPPNTLLRITNMSFAYPQFSNGNEGFGDVLRSINLTVCRGDYIAVLGANGCGKSTLFSCIAGLCRPRAGEITFSGNDGAPFSAFDLKNRVRLRRLAACVLQNSDDQIVGLTVMEDVAFAPLNMGFDRERAAKKALAALETVGLAHRAASNVNALSGGERQRLCFACALAADAEFFMLDEAFSMLDEINRAKALDILDALIAQNKTIFHITHSREEALRARRAILLENGSVTYDGAPEKLDYLTPHNAPWTQAGDNSTKPGAPPLKKENAVVFNNVCLSYGAGEKTNAILQDLSCTIPKGEITALTGASGSGKTTMLKLINALLLPSKGSVVVLGKDTRDKKIPVKFFRTSAGLAVQNCESALFEYYTSDDVSYGARLGGAKGNDLIEGVSKAMDGAGLPFDKFADRPCYTLSGGEKRRAALAGVLVLKSEIVLLDEAEAGLDAAGREKLFAMLRLLKGQGKTIIITTHSKETAAFADNRITLPDICYTGGRAVPEIPPPKKLRRKTGLEFFKADGGGIFSRGFSLKKIAAVFLRLFPIILIIALLQIIFNIPGDSSSVLFKLAFITITELELRRALFLVLRLTGIILCITLFFSFVPLSLTLKAVNAALSALSFFHIDASDVKLTVSIIFRFVPILTEEAFRILTAQMSRGGGRGRLRDGVAIITPLLLRALERAEKLSQAMELRGFGMKESKHQKINRERQ